MSNRIGPVDSGSLGKIARKPDGAAVGEAGAVREQARPQADHGQPAGDRVELTGSARIAALAEEMLATVPDIDRARVAEVRDAIANGEYEIDAERIADALLKSDLEFKR